MLRIKPGVKLCGLKPEMMIGVMVVESVWRKVVPGGDCTITSVGDGNHRRASLHWIGCAVDFRVRDVLVERWWVIERECGEALGDEFDVVLNTQAPCLHVEWQPK